eukprot:86996-Prorocentrum_minimum.AAC.1
MGVTDSDRRVCPIVIAVCDRLQAAGSAGAAEGPSGGDSLRLRLGPDHPQGNLPAVRRGTEPPNAPPVNLSDPLRLGPEYDAVPSPRMRPL